MYDNHIIISLKQKKIKFKPRIKLSHNTSVTGVCVCVGGGGEGGGEALNKETEHSKGPLIDLTAAF